MDFKQMYRKELRQKAMACLTIACTSITDLKNTFEEEAEIGELAAQGMRSDLYETWTYCQEAFEHLLNLWL